VFHLCSRKSMSKALMTARYSFRAAETVDFVQYRRGRRCLFNHDVMDGDLWPMFRSLLPSIARDWDVRASELLLGTSSC